jgi:hypothetical protein
MMPIVRSIRTALATALFLLCVSQALAGEEAKQPRLPESFSVTYVLTKGPLTLAEMTRKLYQNKQGHYVFESYSKPVGYARWFTDSTLLEKTEWIYHGNQLRPLFYSYDRKSSKRERHVHLSFDWEKMRVTNNINNEPWTMKIPEGTLDKLLYHLAVMYDLERGKRALSYQVADGGTLKDFKFIDLGNETIKTPLGTFDTVKLKYTGKRETLLWCAKELAYLPVRMTQDDKGISLTMKIKSVSGLDRKDAQAGSN